MLDMSMLVQPPGQTVHQLTPAHSYANVEDDVFMSGGEAPRLIFIVLGHFDLFSIHGQEGAPVHTHPCPPVNGWRRPLRSFSKFLLLPTAQNCADRSLYQESFSRFFHSPHPDANYFHGLLSWDGTTRKKMSRRKSHQNRLIFLKKFQKNHGSASLN